MSHPTIEAVADLAAADPFARAEFQDRRRSEPRILCDREVSIIPCAANFTAGTEDLNSVRPLKARLTDCSLHGLGMMLPEAVEAAQQVLVKVEMNRLPMMLLYTVRYCVPMKTNEFRCGLRFCGYVASKFRGEMRTVLGALTGT
jgi:hypothetical protein